MSSLLAIIMSTKVLYDDRHHSGAYGVQYDFLSLMDAATFIYAKDLQWGSYTGIWVQWKNPRDW